MAKYCSLNFFQSKVLFDLGIDNNMPTYVRPCYTLYLIEKKKEKRERTVQKVTDCDS